jgi:hypothetical protein
MEKISKNHNLEQIVIFLIGCVILDTEESRKTLIVSNQKLMKKRIHSFSIILCELFHLLCGL